MRQHVRLAIAGCFGLVLAGGLGSLGARGASAETCAGVTRLFTCGALMLSAIGAICGEGGARPRFAGFAVFGWGYFALAHWYTYHEGPMPTVAFVPGSGELHSDLRSMPPLVRVAHDAWALVFGILGMILGGLLARRVSAAANTSRKIAGRSRLLQVDARGPSCVGGGSVPRPDGPAPIVRHPTPPGGWRKPAFVGLLALTLVVTSALAGWRWDPGIAAGTVFLITWGVMGLAVLGAVSARGRLRQACFGAAGFGLGYLALAFAPISTAVLPTNHLLNTILRPGGPTTSADLPGDDLATDSESRRLSDALAQPVSLHYPALTSLGVIVDEIKSAIRWPLGKDLVIVVNPYELRLSTEELNGLKVTIDRERIPMKDALRLCLKPLGYRYRIQSGYVRILPDVFRPVPFEQDPIMIAGHSLLALIAAAFGGAAAPLVATVCRRQSLSG